MKRREHGCRFEAILLLLVSVLLLAREAKFAQAASADEAKQTITVVDSIGRQVKVPVPVKRIACLYAFSGHVVAMLGRGNDIVAISRGLRRDILLNSICPRIGQAVAPKGPAGINIEELLLAEPDIVFVPAETARNKGEAEKLETFHLPYLVVGFNTVAGQQRTIEMMGKAIGAEDRAREYIEYYRRCIHRVQSVVTSIPQDRRVRVYQATVEATRTYGKNSLPADWMRLTGVVDVAIDRPLLLQDGEQHVSLEQILRWDPDIILVNEPSVTDYIRHDPQWATLKAVKEKTVYQMPIGISRWGHPGSLETPLAMLWTAKTAYPERFAGIDLKQETEVFYKKFFGIELSADLYSQIMSGKGMRAPKMTN
jgi:iron complex transport system substrate-binding protein